MNGENGRLMITAAEMQIRSRNYKSGIEIKL
jgi:hypothetical protein